MSTEPVTFDETTYPYIDMWSDEYNDRNLELLKEIRENYPLARQRQGSKEVYIVTRYADLWKVHRDWRTFSSARAASVLAGQRYEDPPETAVFVPLDTDPPKHSGWREVIEPLMTLREMEAHAPLIEEIAEQLLDNLQGQTRFKVMENFVRPLQSKAIFAIILGIPADGLEQWHQWANEILFDPEKAASSTEEMTAALAAIVADRRENPRENDIVTTLATARPGGDDLDDTELLKVLIAMTIGGLESTGTVLSGTIHHMGTHPDDLQELKNDKSLLPEAIEEAVRLFVNVTLTQRTVTKETTLQGVDLKPGDKIWNLPGSANRDEQQFPNAEEWDVHRANKRHVSFGAGIHRCLGSNLARIFLRVAFEAVIDRMPGLRIPEDQEILRHSMPTRGIHEFEIEVDEISSKSGE